MCTFTCVYIYHVHWKYTDSNRKTYLKLQFTTYGRLSKKNEIGRACGTYGRQEKNIQVMVARPEGKRPVGRPRNRWEDNIKMDSQEMGWAPVLN